ncbi:hypothetical protein SASPL_132919 [Salvia splendens]|uniref:Uncharacterized protein n=1 Tax=Salvia splendens TaxID=180675 RepID=A0A8X8X0C0_SALSN|nr:hypothetical protein SASPL_132919 [Salvia splendens]
MVPCAAKSSTPQARASLPQEHTQRNHLPLPSYPPHVSPCLRSLREVERSRGRQVRGKYDSCLKTLSGISSAICRATKRKRCSVWQIAMHKFNYCY